MFESVFPSTIYFVLLSRDEATCYNLEPEDVKILGSLASYKRREEFKSGRIAARKALADLGITGKTRVLKGEKGEPVWPDTVIGSITHSGDFAAAAVALKTDYQAVGIDLERYRPCSDKFAERICTDSEFSRLPLDKVDKDKALIEIFSAKECFYKAFNCLITGSIGFKDVELMHKGSYFLVNVLGESLVQFPYKNSVQIKLHRQRGYVLSSLAIPANVNI